MNLLRMVLPQPVSDTWCFIATCLIFCPVALDAVTEFGGVDFARPFYDAWWRQATANGINEENFASWLRNAESYPEMFAFLVQGAYERIWEFVSGHRLPKVLGLFIISGGLPSTPCSMP